MSPNAINYIVYFEKEYFNVINNDFNKSTNIFKHVSASYYKSITKEKHKLKNYLNK